MTTLNTSQTFAESEDRLLKVSEVAELLGCSARLVWSLRSEGKLDAVKVSCAVRFRLSDVRRIVANGAPA